LISKHDRIDVGGQAVIEGVMMRSPKAMSIAVRKPDGSIIVREDEWKSISMSIKPLKWPFLRGGLVLLEAMINGFQALMFSADQALDQDEEPISPLAMTGTIVLAFGLGLLLFVVLPHVLSAVMGHLPYFNFDINSLWFHLVDGVIKIFFFISYILLISLSKDIRRVFQYHGAEHKSIFAYEAGDELTIPNVKKYSRFHPRCGTAFILVVLLISIFIFSSVFPLLPFFKSDRIIISNILQIFLKMVLMFPIAGISYEFIKLSGKYQNNFLLGFAVKPGLWMQNITTKEPDDDQIEVAIKALKSALRVEHEQIVPPEKLTAL